MSEEVSFEKYLESGKIITYTNNGYSMYPLLRPGRDLFSIKKTEQRLKKYDVALFRQHDKYILHRVIRVKASGYDMAGDHNSFIESDVKDEQILGKMISFVRDGKDYSVCDMCYLIYSRIIVWFYPARKLIRGIRRKK